MNIQSGNYSSGRESTRASLLAVLEIEMARTAFTGLETSLLLIQCAENQPDRDQKNFYACWQTHLEQFFRKNLRIIDRYEQLTPELYAVVFSSIGHTRALGLARQLLLTLSGATDPSDDHFYLPPVLKLALLSHSHRQPLNTPERLLAQARELLQSTPDNTIQHDQSQDDFCNTGVTAEEKSWLLRRP